ncbi:BQ2448_530 [Microbotryum intermedium]|uniref:BQ2448_530 protein n=1 Tax=Microbotryum intermedium TaxID=269621 RepID=A0A238F6M8_9BASI|nr:BQ2448_530 [Microbotryum intermedium]
MNGHGPATRPPPSAMEGSHILRGGTRPSLAPLTTPGPSGPPSYHPAQGIADPNSSTGLASRFEIEAVGSTLLSSVPSTSATSLSATTMTQYGATARQQARLAGKVPSPLPRTEPDDGGPSYKVPMYALFTRIAALEPGVEFPAIADERDQKRVEQWMQRDLDYERANLDKKRMRTREVQSLLDEASVRQDWLGPRLANEGSGVKPTPSNRLRIKTEQERERDRRSGKRGPHRKEVKMSKAQLRDMAKSKECLIPIRLEIEHEVYRLRDTFTWNLRETMVTPEIFASHLCEDLRLPYAHFYKEVVAQIKRAIEDAQMTENYDAYLGDDLGHTKEMNRRWFQQGQHKLTDEDQPDGEVGLDVSLRARQSALERAEEPIEMNHEQMNDHPIPKPLTDGVLGVGDDFAPREASVVVEGASDAPAHFDIYANEELRVTIKLDITIDSVQLVDQFEWDLSDAQNSPEEFAETFATELGLNGDFQTAICHSIREQLDVFTRSLCILGHAQGLLVPDEELRRQFLTPVSEPIRTESAADYTPLLNQLTPDEVDRNDKEREREVRRKRRQTKGRGVTLPDRDFVRTHRTIVPKSTGVPIISYQDTRGEIMYPMGEIGMPYPIVAPSSIEKPPDLETHAASPLKLIHTKGQPGLGHVVDGKANKNQLKRSLGDGLGYLAAGDASAQTQGDANKRPAGPGRGRRTNLEALGLHPHIIDGAWYCANCGVPDSIAVGRRKGPTGANSLCGQCGKFFHRYRRNRPCTYTTDPETHRQAKEALDAAAAAAKLAKNQAAAQARAAAAAAAAASAAAIGDEASMASAKLSMLSTASDRGGTATRDNSSEESGNDDDDSDDGSSVTGRSARPKHSNRSPRGPSPFAREGSTDSDLSSASDSPRRPSTSDVRTMSIGGKGIPPLPTHAPAPSFSSNAARSTRPADSGPPVPPTWMHAAAAELRAKQVDDRFDIIPRPRPVDPTAVQEWRIRCLDCPGKLYNVGPGETLDNFSVHFKNRVHRGNVEARLKGLPPPPHG